MNRNEFILDVIEENKSGELVVIGQKTIYNLDKSKSASDWVREDIKKFKTTKDCIQLTNAINIQKKKTYGSNFTNSLGYFVNEGNDVSGTTQNTSLFTAAYSHGHGWGISPDNFYKCVTLFSARSLIKSNWIISQDEFIAPNEHHNKWNEFVCDSVIYSLFSPSSQQSSLRKVEYKGRRWDIKNEFFWMKREELLNMSNQNAYEEMYCDCNSDGDRFVYNYINSIKDKLSIEAKQVLDKACELVRSSFKLRKYFNDTNPEYQIMNWDCGWYQVKGMLKEYMPNELKEFNELFNKLANKMRPMVYEVGFLKK